MFDFLIITQAVFDAMLFIALLIAPFALYTLTVMLRTRRRQRHVDELRRSRKQAYVEDLFRQIG